jgi:uridylate kinase
MAEKPIFDRVLVKLSGEVLMGSESFGIDPDVAQSIAREIHGVHSLGVQMAAVIGEASSWDRPSRTGMDRCPDHGHAGDSINAVALQDALEKLGIHTRVQSAIEMRAIAEPFIRRRAMRHLEKGRVVIFAAGTGNPYFSTDTAAALRAMEIKADVIMKGTRVAGIYSADPETNPGATFFENITYREVIEKRLKVMDTTAISLCMDNRLPIIVFDVREPGNMRRVVLGERVGTKVTGS